MKSETTSLTEWEAKERAGLLALETDEWREKRLIAEDPDTTAEVLAEFGDLILRLRGRVQIIRKINPFAGLLAEAVSAHPNTPPSVLCNLLDGYVPLCFPAFCRNHITPFLVLESPNFWQRLYGNVEMCQRLLREEKLPSVAASALTMHPWEGIAQAAQLHISIAGEVQTEAEGVAGIYASKFAEYAKDYHIHVYTLYVRDMEFLRAEGYAHQLRTKGTSADWMERLFVAFQLPLNGEPFYEGEENDADWNRSPLELLYHLAHDGNRFVRWAAQTRLADPNFVFTWADEE